MMMKLGHWERKRGCGNSAVSMATIMLTELSPTHLSVITMISKHHVKYTVIVPVQHLLFHSGTEDQFTNECKE